MFFLYRIGKFLALILPRKWGYFLASLLADLKYFFSKKDREVIVNNLKEIFPDKDSSFIKIKAKKVFRNFGKYLVDFFRTSKIDLNFVKDNVKFINRDYLEECLKKKRGVIAFTCHLGNWELGAQVSSLVGYPVYGVALAHKDERVNAFFNRQRLLKGVRVIPLKKGIFKILRLLKNNKIIGILGDRNFSDAGVEVKFFNRKSLLPRGVYYISKKFNVPILPTFFVRDRGDKYLMIYEKPIYPEKKSLEQILDECVKVMEKYIRQYPEQWFMFERFWKD